MKHVVAALLAATISASAIAGSAVAGEAIQNPLTESEMWQDLQYDIIGETTIADGRSLFEVEAPYRAHDAATVPIIIKQLDRTREITGAKIVIDENPAPLAADLTFGAAMAPLNLELRVRINQYSNVRVIAETPDGSFMNGRFVKASGGCSAPATRDPQLALASMGQMKLRHFERDKQMSTARREAQIMIRHPNYSGLQRDQITQLFINAHFIDDLEVRQGDDLLFRLEGGISISENPVFRFEYSDNGAPSLRVRATDTEGNVFERELAKATHS